MKILYDDLSPASQEQLEINGIKTKSYSQKKMISDFRKRTEYVVHVSLFVAFISIFL